MTEAPLQAGRYRWPSQKEAARDMRVSPTTVRNWLDAGNFIDKAIMRMVKMRLDHTQIEIMDGDQYLVSHDGVCLQRMARPELEAFSEAIRDYLRTTPHKPVKRDPVHGGPIYD